MRNATHSDAQVLEQLLLVQKALEIPSCAGAVIDFLCRALEIIPGVASARFCRPSTDQQAALDPLAPGASRVQGAPSEGAGNVCCIVVTGTKKTHGSILVELSDQVAFAPYEPYLQYLASAAALELESREARDSFQAGGNPHLAEEAVKREQREVDLRKQQRYYETAFENAPGVIVYVDLDSRILRANRRALEILQVGQEAIFGKTVFDFFPPENAARFRARDLEVIHSGQPLLGLIEQISLPSGRRWVRIDKLPCRDASGMVVGVIIFATDIHDWKLTEQALIEAYAFREQVMHYVTNAIYALDLMGRFRLMSRAGEAITGYAPEELVGQSFAMLFEPEVLMHVREQFLQCALHGQNIPAYEAELVRKDGSKRWISFKLTPVYEEEHIVSVVGVAEDISERREADARLIYLAHHDMLTGLPNRAQFLERMQRAIARARRNDAMAGVLFLDLDQFKGVNDSLGHEAGDLLLQCVAQRLRDVLRETDTMARFGGDEFAVLLEDVTEEELVQVVEKLLQVVAAPLLIKEQALCVTLSVGISLFPRDGEDASALLKSADMAMYCAKEHGRNGYRFYRADMNTRIFERMQLVHSLRRALEQGEFLLYYQPRADLRTGKITGVEALLRWRHPERGLVAPGEFIAVLEESGLIAPVGEWVLREACAQLRRWQALGLTELCMAVNLSSHQFRQPGLVRYIARMLQETGLEAKYLEIELTESAIMHDPKEAAATLREIKQMGVAISVDDFGTGYSSLSYLQRFTLDILKIDRSFIQDITTNPDNAALTRAIIAMAQSLRLRVIAEGVETEGQLAYLRKYRCDEMQGYFFHRPLPAGEMTSVLQVGKCLACAPMDDMASQRTLLILDDEDNVRTALARLFRVAGYRILSTGSPKEAFELLARNEVGVILSDQRMPEMSGTEFLNRIKGLYPNTVRIILSGYADLKTVTDAVNQGWVYRFLSKPWDGETLRKEIREAFQHYETTRSKERLLNEMRLMGRNEKV